MEIPTLILCAESVLATETLSLTLPFVIDESDPCDAANKSASAPCCTTANCQYSVLVRGQMCMRPNHHAGFK